MVLWFSKKLSSSLLEVKEWFSPLKVHIDNDQYSIIKNGDDKVSTVENKWFGLFTICFIAIKYNNEYFIYYKNFFIDKCKKKVDELNNMSIKDFVKLFANIFKEEDARLQKEEEEEEERIRQEEERIRQEEEQLRQKPVQLDENDCKPNQTYNSFTRTCTDTHDGGSKKKSNKRIKRKRRNKTRKHKNATK